MPTGLREEVHLNRIVLAMRDVEEEGLALNEAARCQGIVDAVFAELTNLQVPLPTLQVAALPGLNGQFAFSNWTLKVNQSLAQIPVRGTTPQQKKTIYANLGDTIVHESRHCEQWFRMARLRVTKMWLDRSIKPTAHQMADLGIPANILAIAIQRLPLTPEEMSETSEWYASVYGTGQQFRQINAYGRNLRSAALPRGNLGPSAFSQAGYDFSISEFARYEQSLAEEKDAHETGRRLQTIFLAGSGVAAQELVGHRRAAATY